MGPSSHTFVFLLLAMAVSTGCSVKKYAINKIGDSLASGQSVWESDEDVDLVGDALPFSLKLLESLLAESPKHRGLLLTACRGFVLYSYAYVDYESEVAEDEDIDRARVLRRRARKLYLRGLDHCFRGVERSYPGFTQGLTAEPETAVLLVKNRKKKWDVPFLYWSAAALGLAISVSGNDAAMLARIPEVEALIDRALELDEDWDHGALHEFQVTFLGAKPGAPDVALVEKHYQRALTLSQGRSAGLYLAYAETVTVPQQNRREFRSLLQKTLAVDADAHPENRLVNLLAQRRAGRLLDRIDELFLNVEESAEESQP